MKLEAENPKDLESAAKGSVFKGGYALRGTPSKKEEDKQDKKITVKSDEASESKKLQKKLRKIKLDEKEEAIQEVEGTVLAETEVSEGQVKSVFKMISSLFNEKRSSVTSLEELWKYVAERKDAEVRSREELEKCLRNLDQKNKIMYVRNENKIFSLYS